MDREAVMIALWSTVSSSSVWKTKGTELLHWSSVPNQPALFVGAAEETGPNGPSNLPGPITYTVELWVYTQGKERTDGNRQKALIALQQVLEASLSRSPITNRQSLGDLVIDARLTWPDVTAPGHHDGQAVAVAEVEILTAPDW